MSLFIKNVPAHHFLQMNSCLPKFKNKERIFSSASFIITFLTNYPFTRKNTIVLLIHVFSLKEKSLIFQKAYFAKNREDNNAKSIAHPHLYSYKEHRLAPPFYFPAQDIVTSLALRWFIKSIFFFNILSTPLISLVKGKSLDDSS